MKKILVLIVSVSALCFLGCSPATNPYGASGKAKDLSIAIALPCHDQSAPEIKSAYVYVSGYDFDTFISELSVASCTISGIITDIPVGKNRHIELKIYDINDQLSYYGDDYTNIEIGVTTNVVIRLKSSGSGSVAVTGVICDGHENNKSYDTAAYLNLTGCWKIKQSNNEWGTIQLNQIGDSIFGYSRWVTHSNGPIIGKIIEGDSVVFRITYPNGEGYGDYYGKFSTIAYPMGDVYGYNADTFSFKGWTLGSSGATATWDASKGDCDNPADTIIDIDIDSMVAYYNFDEISGDTLFDVSGNGHHGKLVSGHRVSGVSGKGLFLDTGDYAIFDTILPNRLKQGTIELYFKLPDSINLDTATYILFGNDGSRGNLLLTKGRLMFMKNHSDIFKYISAPGYLQPGVWYHVAATWGNSGMRLFLNGELIASNSEISYYETSPRTTEENIFYIGYKSWCCMNGAGIYGPLSFTGYLDEIRISSFERY